MHSLGTAEMAGHLAEKFGLNVLNAKIAGLLHDCAKEYTYEQMLELIKNKAIEIDEDEINSPKVLHAPLSAYIAKNQFRISDKEILDAIKYHTIGRIGMSNFEKIIFLADKIELNTRIEPCFELIRAELKESNNLDKTIFLCSKMTIKSLLDRNLEINFKTIDLYNYLLKNRNK